MDILEFTKRDGMSSVTYYMQKFSFKLNIVPFKEKFVKKLASLCGLKPWIRKIVYRRVDIPNTCQGFVKLVECMEDHGLPHYQGVIESKVTYKNNVGPNNGNKSGAKASQGFMMTRKNCRVGNHWEKRCNGTSQRSSVLIVTNMDTWQRTTHNRFM
jgi:hypothetical protein